MERTVAPARFASWIATAGPFAGGYAIEALWQPAAETGGEVFDVLVGEPAAAGAVVAPTALLLLEPDSFGVEAAVLSAQLRAVFRSAVRAGATPAAIAGHLQRCLEEDLREPGTVRAWIGLLDVPTGRLDWVAAGFAGNLVHRRAVDGAAELLDSSDPALGATRGQSFRGHAQMLAPGDLLAVVSDGVIDAMSDARERFGTALAAHVRAAHCALAQGAAGRALPHVEAARRLAPDYEMDSMYPGELWWVAYRVYSAGHDPVAAQRMLAEGCDWVQAIAREHVPAEYRDGFLHRNPVNRALLTERSRSARGACPI